ncbi:hypothetical protein CSPX01_05622 [Colletotrichum filicis]|nr:hypothetical protein CSPX01_05622 [Colletotrichum filicis]
MASIHTVDGNDAVTERQSSRDGLPMSIVAFNDPFQDPVRTRRRTSSSQSYPISNRDVHRLSFKTALRVTCPEVLQFAPGDSWDGSSTPKRGQCDGYFGSLPATPTTPQSLPRPSTSTSEQEMLPPDVPSSPKSVLSSNGPLSPSSEEFQTRVLQNTASTAVGINSWRKLWCSIDKPEHPEPEKHQTVFFVQEHDCQYIGVRPSGVYSNVEQKQSSESISESLASEQLADVPKNISSSPISKTLTWFTNKEDQRSTATGTSWFGKAPWHRKDSNDTISSATSSVRDFLAGKTPPVTPDPEGFLSRQQDSTLTPYPAGEATRVRTPPTHEDTADGKPRGFFTDMVPPGEDSDTWDAAQPARSTSVKRNQTRCDDNLPKRPKEWWEAKQRIQPKRRLTGPRNFEFDLPEHLPSSPMCPANPKHVSGGTGVCVYHGRGRKESTLKIEHKMSDRRQGSEVSITSETDERSIWD